MKQKFKYITKLYISKKEARGNVPIPIEDVAFYCGQEGIYVQNITPINAWYSLAVVQLNNLKSISNLEKIKEYKFRRLFKKAIVNPKKMDGFLLNVANNLLGLIKRDIKKKEVIVKVDVQGKHTTELKEKFIKTFMRVRDEMKVKNTIFCQDKPTMKFVVHYTALPNKKYLIATWIEFLKKSYKFK